MVRNVKPIIYIFCEGTTEEKYFIQLGRILNNKTFKVKTFDLEGGTEIMNNPEKVKKFILNKLKHEKITGLTQKVFIVFDLDIFTDKSKLQNTLNILSDFYTIVTNEVFEYWILSHFEKYTLGKGKAKYIGKIKTHLPDLSNDKFTGRRDYEWLNSENVNVAIDNVKSVNINYGSFKDRDPYSNVYNIIEFLEK